MTRWRKADYFGLPALWRCDDPECESWGSHGGDTQRQNTRRAKADAREHTDETGHRTEVQVMEGAWER